MQHFRNDTPQKSLSLILSIILHIMLFLLFLYLHWPKTPKEQMHIEDLQPTQPTLPEPALFPELAALKTRASQFGAPVIFQEEPTFTPPDEQKSSEEQKPSVEPPAEPAKAIAEPAPEPKAQEPKSFIAEPQAATPKISFKPEKTQKQEQTAEQSVFVPAETKKPSFADLAKGFIQTMHDQGGQDLFERKGNENIRPDMEELKVISYQQKIIWFIQNSFRAMGQDEPLPQEPLLLCPTILTVNEDGSILQLQLVESTGYVSFDAYYLKVIRNAAPFPPVPNHIPKPFTFRFTAQHYTQRTPNHPMKRKKPTGIL